MILPIYAFGYGVLKREAKPISQDHDKLDELIKNMWDTMYNAKGVGLAGPQIGLSLRIFLVDTVQLEGEEDEVKNGIKKTFINAKILEESGDFWAYEEGCLSIPQIRGEVERQKKIKIYYLDENFEEHTEEYEGINARVIQHEYDHIEGKLFTEKLKPLKKKMIKRKLEKIRVGKIETEYRMKFPG